MPTRGSWDPNEGRRGQDDGDHPQKDNGWPPRIVSQATTRHPCKGRWDAPTQRGEDDGSSALRSGLVQSFALEGLGLRPRLVFEYLKPLQNWTEPKKTGSYRSWVVFSSLETGPDWLPTVLDQSLGM